MTEFRQALVYGNSTLKVRFGNSIIPVPPLSRKEPTRDLRLYILKKQFRKRICAEVPFSPQVLSKIESKTNQNETILR